jgi:iron complex outermembrane receptor protein
VFATAARNQFQIPGALTEAQYESDPQQAQDDPSVYNPTYVDRDERRDNRLARVGTTIAHSFNEHNAVSGMAFVQGKFLERSERNTFRDFTRVHVGGNAVYHAAATVAGVRNRMLVGTDAQFQDGAILFYSLDSNGQRGEQLRRDGREAALNVGVFAQDEIMLDDWSILVGARYDAITYSSAEHIAPAMEEERTFEQVTPKLGLNWRMTEDMSLYANLGGGIEVPAGNELTPTSVGGEDTVHLINPLLEPIRSATYELGVKGTMQTDGMLRSLSYDGAAYYIDIRNDLIPYRNGRYYFSAGRSIRMGGEVGASVRTSWNLTLSGSFTYMHSEYVEYTIDSTFYGKPGASADLSGNAQAGIPDAFSTVSLRYDAPLPFPAWILAEARSVGSYFADDANTLQADAYTVLDAAIGMDHPLSSTLSVALALRVNNVFDSKYMASVWINPDTTPGGTPYIEPGLPRNVSLSVGLRWND